MLLLLVILFNREKPLTWWLTFVFIAAEIIALNLLITQFGAATNPFAIILLVPLVIGLALLPLYPAALTLLMSIALQLFQLANDTVPPHHSMAQHAASMVWGFVMTSILLAAVITYFRWQLAKREGSLRQLREKQLRDEQLLAIGTAAAQLTHDTATPVQTLTLLFEEFFDTRDMACIEEANEQILLMSKALSQWRDIANDVREKKTTQYSSNKLLDALKHTLALARPEAQILWKTDVQEVSLTADRTLLPALSNIIVNACEARPEGNEHKVTVHTSVCGDFWTMCVDNPLLENNHDFIQELGTQFMTSKKGYGIGAALSNATIERLNGTVSWQQIEGASGAPHIQTTVSLPTDDDR